MGLPFLLLFLIVVLMVVWIVAFLLGNLFNTITAQMSLKNVYQINPTRIAFGAVLLSIVYVVYRFAVADWIN